MSDIYYPGQIHGISEAVKRLSQFVTEEQFPDEMVHVHHLTDGSGAVSVQFTSPTKTYYVSETGKTFDTRKELEDAVKEEESKALRSGSAGR